jgi:tetratricopeptide (TPR) repeat protein
MNFLCNLFFVFVALLFSTAQLSAQVKVVQPESTNMIDSMKRVLQLQFGKDRLATLRSLHMNFRNTDNEIALNYANQYYSLALSQADSVLIVQGGRMRTYSLINLSKYQEALPILLKTLATAKRLGEKDEEVKNQIKFLINNIGLVYTYLGQYDKALEFQFQSLTIREEEGDKKSIRNALNNVGIIFLNLGDNERAIQYYLKAVEICKELDDFTDQEQLFNNLGLSYCNLGKFDAAIKSFEEEFKICNSKCSDNTVKEVLEGLGFAYEGNHQMEMAKSSFLKSLEIAKRQNDKRYSSENLFHIGLIEVKTGNNEKGIAYLKEAEGLAESINLVEIRMRIYESLENVYGGRRDYRSSLIYANKYIHVKDSIYTSVMIKNLTRIQTDYAERENVKTIRAKDQILLLKEELISKQKLQTILMGSVAILLLLLTGILYKIYRDKLLINIKLDKKVRERTEELRQNNSNLNHAYVEQQSLLQKIQRDGQGIISIFNGLSHTAKLDITDERVKEYFQKVEANTDKLVYLFSRIQN